VNIAITDNHRPKLYFDNYIYWIHRVNPNVELVKLSYHLKNVALGGTLIPDLLSLGFNDHTQRNSQENRHAMRVVPHTMLDVLTGRSEQAVNSIHHQAIDQLGRGLMVSAVSPDGVIEAAEWALKDRMPFLLLVQWHPERMKDFDNPYVRNIAEYFLHEVRQSIDA
jgi:putative glutamine amidotransferase